MSKPKCAHRMKLVLSILLAIGLSSCQVNTPVTERSDNRQAKESGEPTIEATPISKSDDQWQVVSSDRITLNVTAPDAQSVKILYRPAFAEGRHVELKTLNVPTDSAAGRFSTQFKVPSDFAGDVWGEAHYRDGSKKETKPISLTVESISPDELAGASYKHSEESARSDKFTGGRIEQTNLQPGNGDVHITVNIPAFQLTLWQGTREVKLYRSE